MRRVKHGIKSATSRATFVVKSVLVVVGVVIVAYGYRRGDVTKLSYAYSDVTRGPVTTAPMPPPNEKKESHVTNMTSYVSFIDPYTPSCDAIFSDDTDKEAKLAEFAEILEEIRQYDERVNATRQGLLDEKGRCFVGHALQYMEETYVMAKLFRSDFVHTICETGFNVGHSTLLWLLLKPDVTVYSFDINRLKCTAPMAEYLLSKYPERLQVIFGDSTKTLPEFHARHPDVTCDVAIVDGGHTRRIAEADIHNFYNMTSAKNFVFMDNYPDDNFSPALAHGWENAKRSGIIHELFRCKYSNASQGFTLGRYVH